MLLMDEREAPALTSVAVRRRFTAAAWGSAIAWPLFTAAGAPVLLWWLDISWDEALTADFATSSLLPLVPVILYFCVAAVRTVRKEQRELAECAVDLVSAAHAGDPLKLRVAARSFGTTLVMASTAFNTRVLPRRTARSFALRVFGEAEAEGLSPASLHVVQGLARMVA
ncbi:hypothetical protein GCM10010289_70240 [Streptomyces violascens]|nr:hypothetical protein GCM10010289_70240 [Streptomyces violascens]